MLRVGKLKAGTHKYTHSLKIIQNMLNRKLRKSCAIYHDHDETTIWYQTG